MAVESLAQKKSKAQHWIKTYQKRITLLNTSPRDRRATQKVKIRVTMMREKIYHWTRMIKIWSAQEDLKIPAVKLLYFCEKYFTKEQFYLKYIKKNNRIAVICFSKFCCDHGYSNKEMWKAVGLHANTFNQRRKLYDASEMGTFYRNFKNYMNECISKEQQIRKDRKNKIANGERGAHQSDKGAV